MRNFHRGNSERVKLPPALRRDAGALKTARIKEPQADRSKGRSKTTEEQCGAFGREFANGAELSAANLCLRVGVQRVGRAPSVALCAQWLHPTSSDPCTPQLPSARGRTGHGAPSCSGGVDAIATIRTLARGRVFTVSVLER
eukprot:6207570-Pleurochrysis_carterae.AAC.3